MTQSDLFVTVQKTGQINPEKVTHQPQTYRVLASSGDWLVLQWMGARVHFRRSTGLQSNGYAKIVDGLDQIPQLYFAQFLSEDERAAIIRKLKVLNA